MSRVNVKNQAKVIQTRMRELGYPEFKLGHAQEIIAALEGEKSWNVLSSKYKTEEKPITVKEVKSFSDSDVMLDRGGKHSYLVKMKGLAEVSSHFIVKADSIEEALQLSSEEVDSHMVKNWEVVWTQDNSMRVTELENMATRKHLSFETQFQNEIESNVDNYDRNPDFYYLPESERAVELPKWEGLAEKRSECEKGLEIFVVIYNDEEDDTLRVLLIDRDQNYLLNRYFVVDGKVQVAVDYQGPNFTPELRALVDYAQAKA